MKLPLGSRIIKDPTRIRIIRILTSLPISTAFFRLFFLMHSGIIILTFGLDTILLTYILQSKEIPHNTAAHLAVPFPTFAACRFLDLPPVNLRNLQMHLSKNSLAS